MLRISKLTDYATVIMSYLALDPVMIRSVTHIAKATHLSHPTVSKILKILTDTQLVKSFRGTGGGYQLARAVDQITVAEVVSAVEGRLAMTECCSKGGSCMLDSLCAIKEKWQIINNIILTTLSGFTLKQMIRPLDGNPIALKGIPITVQGVSYDK
jgi:FeS assembly SUF system regulator